MQMNDVGITAQRDTRQMFRLRQKKQKKNLKKITLNDF